MNSVWILISLMFGDASGGTVSPLSCGQSSCYLLASRLGKAVTLEELAPHFLDKRPESSMSDLQQALHAFSIETIPWKLNWEDFQKIHGPMICHLAPSGKDVRHFHVAEWRAGELWILDPLAAHPIRISPDLFPQYRQSFSGNVLVPSNAVPWTWRVFGTGFGFYLGGLGLALLIARRFCIHGSRPTPPAKSVLTE